MDDKFGCAGLVPLFEVLEVLVFALEAEFAHYLNLLFLLRGLAAHLVERDVYIF